MKRGVLFLGAVLVGIAIWLWVPAGESLVGTPPNPQAARTPTHGQQTHADSTHRRPTHAGPAQGEPTHGQPTHGQPTHGQPTHGQPNQNAAANALDLPTTLQARNNPIPSSVHAQPVTDSGEDRLDATFDGERPSARSLSDTGNGSRSAVEPGHSGVDVTFEGRRPDDDVTFDGVRPARVLSATERNTAPAVDYTNSPAANPAPPVTPFEPSETAPVHVPVPTWDGEGTVRDL